MVRSVLLLLVLGLATFGCAQPGQEKTVPIALASAARAPLPPAEPPQPFLEWPAPQTALGGEGPMVVVFFATWCDLCSYKLRTVRRATKQIDGAELLLVTVDDARTKHHVPGFLREHGIPEAPVIDGLAHPEFLERYNPASALPFVLVLGRDGRALDAQVGLQSGDGRRLENSLRLALRD